MINQGITGEVTKLPLTISSLFRGLNADVRKHYKAPSLENPFAFEDYANEIAVLEVLADHRKDLPLTIPKVIKHALIPAEDNTDFVAHLDMTGLKDVDCNTPTDQSYDAEKTRRIGQALVYFHRLDISPFNQLRLKRDPIDRLDDKLAQHLLRGAHSDMVDEARALLQELKASKSSKVFIHGDLHPANTCIDKTGAVTGAMDFCYSGIAVRELEFLYYAEHDNHIEAAIDGYMQNGGEKFNMENIALINRIAPVYLEMRNDMTQAKKIMATAPVGTRKLDCALL